MPLIKKLVIFLVLIFGVAFFIGLFLPSEWKVSRSVEIKAKPRQVFPLINDLRNWSQWYPWTRKMDVSMVTIYEGPTKGEGAIKRWSGSDIKNGEIKIVKSVPNREIHYEFHSDASRIKVHGIIALEATPNGCKVTWTDSGKAGLNPMVRLSIGAMDQTIGEKFEKGLQNLKKIFEP